MSSRAAPHPVPVNWEAPLFISPSSLPPRWPVLTRPPPSAQHLSETERRPAWLDGACREGASRRIQALDFSAPFTSLSILGTHTQISSPSKILLWLGFWVCTVRPEDPQTWLGSFLICQDVRSAWLEGLLLVGADSSCMCRSVCAGHSRTSLGGEAQAWRASVTGNGDG